MSVIKSLMLTVLVIVILISFIGVLSPTRCLKKLIPKSWPMPDAPLYSYRIMGILTIAIGSVLSYIVLFGMSVHIQYIILLFAFFIFFLVTLFMIFAPVSVIDKVFSIQFPLPEMSKKYVYRISGTVSALILLVTIVVLILKILND